MKNTALFLVCCMLWNVTAFASAHPRVYIRASELPALREKVRAVPWAAEIVRKWHGETDRIVERHAADPDFAVSRLQMHWEEGRRHTRFFTDGNFTTRREGNAKYPTIRVAYARSWAGADKTGGWERNPPRSDGTLRSPDGASVPFERTGQAAEQINGELLSLAYKSAIIYSLEGDERHARFAADIVWTLVRGGSQQEQLNPDSADGNNGFLSWETLGDTRHYWAIPLVWDLLYDYFHGKYFNVTKVDEGREWALERFHVFFEKFIDNKLTRGGGLMGNWNLNEQQSAMLYALALDDDGEYADGKGRRHYVRALVNGPTTQRHGAYRDVLRANIEEATGMWPEAPGGYGQGSIAQLVKFAFIYWRGGLDLLSRDPLMLKASRAMPQMVFPNGYITNIGDSTYHRIFTDQLELMAAYAKAKGDDGLLAQCAGLIRLAGGRTLNDDIALFFYLPELPDAAPPRLSRVSHAPCYPVVLERNPSRSGEAADALAFSLAGFSEEMGHRHPNGITIELYGRGEILAPDPGAGSDYWSKDTHEYYRHVAAHNTVAVNGLGLDDRRPMPLEVKAAEPAIAAGADVFETKSPHRQFVDVESLYDAGAVKARQRRTVAIVRSGERTGYYVDIFRSKAVEGEAEYHDYIFHCLGDWAEGSVAGKGAAPLSAERLRGFAQSGKGYSYFTVREALEGVSEWKGSVEYGGGVAMGLHVAMPRGPGRAAGRPDELYIMDAPKVFRHYDAAVREKPCPAFMARRRGDAWESPFVAVYEPFGKGVDEMIDRVESEPVAGDPGAVKVTVLHKNASRRDEIVHSPAKGFSVTAFKDGRPADKYSARQ